MFAQFRYLDGVNAGLARAAIADFATLGRHPASDVPFDPELDLEVSARHAAVFKQGGGFMIRDLGSTNGTYLNGCRVRGDLPLEPGDVVQLGPTGPRIEFAVVETQPWAGPTPSPAPPAARRRVRTTTRLAVPSRPGTGRLKWAAASGLAISVVALGQWSWVERRERAAIEAERAALLARADDLLARVEQARPAGVALDRVRRQLGDDLGALRAGIAATPAAEGLRPLARQLRDRAAQAEALLLAAAVDVAPLAAEVAGAMAVVIAEHHDGRVAAGTGFAVRSAGDSVWVVTARLGVEDSSGVPASRLLVLPGGVGPGVQAGIARLHEAADLALLVARLPGTTIPAPRLRDSILTGEPVAMPSVGGGTAGGPHEVKRAPIPVGSVVAAGQGLFEVDSYGVVPEPGAPVVGSDRRVVGVVLGRAPLPGRRVTAASSRWLREWLGPEDR